LFFLRALRAGGCCNRAPPLDFPYQKHLGIAAQDARRDRSHLRETPCARTNAAMTSRPRRASRPSRWIVFPLKTEGAGNAGYTLHPRSRAQCAQRSAHTSIQVQRRHSGIPCAMALRLMPCSPRRRIRLVTVAAGLMAI
jgi:hypothetical protein